MTRDFDFATEFETAHFVLIGHGDGRGTDHVVGYRALCNRIEEDCGEVIDTSAWYEEWDWSDETPPRPYLLHMPFEADGLTVVRLSETTVLSIRHYSPPPAWDAYHNRSYGPVETRAKAIYEAEMAVDRAGKKWDWVEGGNSTMQDEARTIARRELRATGHTP